MRMILILVVISFLEFFLTTKEVISKEKNNDLSLNEKLYNILTINDEDLLSLFKNGKDRNFKKNLIPQNDNTFDLNYYQKKLDIELFVDSKLKYFSGVGIHVRKNDFSCKISYLRELSFPVKRRDLGGIEGETIFYSKRKYEFNQMTGESWYSIGVAYMEKKMQFFVKMGGDFPLIEEVVLTPYFKIDYQKDGDRREFNLSFLLKIIYQISDKTTK